MLNFKQAKTMITNLTKVGAKLKQGISLKTAATKIMPVAEASLVLNGLRELPVFSQILTGLDRLFDLAVGAIGKIPIIGWTAEIIANNVVKPVSNFLGGYRYPQEENDRTWYTAVKSDLIITDTSARPIGLGYTSEVTQIDPSGAVPRLMHLNVNLFQIHKMYAFEHTMTDLWENITNGMRRSVTYSQNQVAAYINNSIMYYILAKYFEKKIGFMKFSEVSYPDFREDWSLIYNQKADAGLTPATINTMLDLDPSNLSGFTHTKEIYEVICKLDRTFLLPTNLKNWIDRYFGTVFVIDQDSANNKFIDVNPITLYFATYVPSDDSIVYNERDLTSFTIDELLNVITEFFKTNATIRADLNNAQVFSTSYDSKTPLLNIMSTGWLTDYDQYNPTPVVSDTFVQALINAYTTNTNFGNLFKNNFVRFDYLNDEKCGDEFTALLFSGAVVPSDNVWLKDGHMSTENVAIVMRGTAQSPITVPESWIHPITPSADKEVTAQLTTPYVAIFKSNSNEIDDVTISVTNPKDSGTTRVEFTCDTTADEALPEDITGVTYSVTKFSTNSYSKLFVGDINLMPDAGGGVHPLNYVEIGNILNSNDQLDMFIKIAQLTGDESHHAAYAHIQITKDHSQVWGTNPDLYDLVLDAKCYLLPSTESTAPEFVIGSGTEISYGGRNYKLIQTTSNTSNSNGVYNTYDFINALEDFNDRWDPSHLPFRDVTSITFGSFGTAIYPNIYCETACQYYRSGAQLVYFSTVTFEPASPWLFASNVILCTTDSSTKASVAYAATRYLVGFAAWCHMAMGYSIPIEDKSKEDLLVTVDATTIFNTHDNAPVLLKEDYVPFFINRFDLPWILYYVYASLLYMELLPYKKK